MPEQPTFEISARGIAANESTTGAAPDWAEIRLSIASGNWGDSWSLTRAACHQIIEALRGSLGPSGGLTITELIWGQLDEVMDRLMVHDGRESPEDRGVALGLATAIAILRRPDAYDVNAVREEAMNRWEARQGL